MVNVYGVLSQTRYMPDRRDLNRSFPGSAKGSLTGRMAHTFISEIACKCQYGIDLHTGAIHRSNLPQIRANLDDQETKELAEAFGVPVLINSNIRDGSLRQAASESGTKVLLYEAGEALRFEELAIRAGVKGVLGVLRHLGMTRRRSITKKKKFSPFIANNSAWARATVSGFVSSLKQLGDQVEKKEVLALIHNPLGEELGSIVATKSGIIVGRQNIPMVQEGDAMFHIGYFSEDEETIAETIEIMHAALLPEDEI